MLNKDNVGQRLDAAAVSIPGEEDLRFARNFHDVFLATGIVLLINRRALLKHAPRTGVWARIFPPETSLESAPRTVATA